MADIKGKNLHSASGNAGKSASTTFTVDAETTGIHEMPSITKLLNRKTLNKSDSSPPPVPPPFQKKPASKPTVPPPRKAPESGPVSGPLDIQTVDISESQPSEGGIVLEAPSNVSQSTPSIELGNPTEVKVAEDALSPIQREDSRSMEFTPAQMFSMGGKAEGKAAPVSEPQQGGIEISVMPDEIPDEPGQAVEIPVVETSPPNEGQKPSVRVPSVVQRRGEDVAQALPQWDPAVLQGSTDPMARVICDLLANGAHDVLFLGLMPIEPGKIPEFKAMACTQNPQRQQLWSGLKWDPAIFPEIWNAFVRDSCVEFPPAGTQTQITSTRNTVRSAFGAHREGEWLTIVRVGPLTQCRGILAVYSGQTVTARLTSAREALDQAIEKRKKAA